MAVETTIAPKTVWQKLLIYWHTKNHSQKMYDIALILATAIYTNHKVYEEELREADHILHQYLREESSIAEIMEYVQLKVSQYMANETLWQQDLQKCRLMIRQDQQLYTHFLSIFEADHELDSHEIAFAESIRTMLLRHD